ncbi:Sm-like ribonucleoprotein [Atractiella rhizophila]|nr:Sm-like ribonucleoprotein [Atractiella rhizophila]
MSTKKGGKLMGLIHYRVRVTLNDSRTLIGQLLAFDKHMNLVLAECEEFRTIKMKKKKDAGGAGVGGTGEKMVVDGEEGSNRLQEIKRSLGLTILRGETIVSISVEGPPPVVDESKQPNILPGPGVGRAVGRGVGLAPPPGMMRGGPMPFPPRPPGAPGLPPPPPGMLPGMMPPPGFSGPPPGFMPPPPR